MMDRHDELETLLSLAPHVDDEGFTERVMAQLPARAPTLRTRTAILLASTVASCGVVALVPGARQLLVDISLGLAGSSAATGPGLVAAAAVVALLVWGAVAAASSEA